jgi:chaperone BCS1
LILYIVGQKVRLYSSKTELVMWHFLQSLMSSNQFMSGGVVMVVMGGLLAYARNLPKQIWNFCLNHFTTTMTVEEKSVTSSDDSFRWVKRWLENQPQAKKFRGVTPSIVWQHTDDRHEPVMLMSPRNTSFFVRYKSSWMLFITSHKEVKMGDVLIGYTQTISIRKLGRSSEVFKSLLTDAYKLYCPPDERRVGFHTFLHSWSFVHSAPPRDPASVILEEGLFEEIYQDMLEFKKAQDWYDSMGIPYRRGYLFHGDPGNGKTSFAITLAGKLRSDLGTINISNLSDDQRLIEAFHQADDRSIILLEDIDACFSKERKPSDDNKGVTFSGLLNAIDGVLSKPGRIVIMTTNHIERLDPALIRPGRADVHIEIKNPSHAQIEKMIRRFYPEVTDGEVRAFLKAIPERSVGMSVVQSICLANKRSVQGAISSAYSLVKKREEKMLAA